LLKRGKIFQLLTAGSRRKYISLLAKWAKWTAEPKVISWRKNSRRDGISREVLTRFCEMNVTEGSCGQFKSAMLHLHAKDLRKGGMTTGCIGWKKLKSYCVLESKSKPLSSRKAATLEETKLFWKLTKDFHPTGWLMMRVCYEGCLRRQDLADIKFNSFRLNAED
jgi:hypothetical protein